MKTTLTRLFTVMMLMMVSMGAKAQVKVLFGENGDDKFKTDGDKIEVTYDGGSIVVTQKVVDATKVTVFLTVTPNKGYTMQEKNVIEAYATAPANIGGTRAPQASEKLTLDCEDFKDEYSTRTYHVDIDPNLALWVKSADFTKKDSGAKGTPGEDEPFNTDFSGVYYIANDNSGGSNSGSTETTAYINATDEIRWFLVPAGNPQQLTDYRDAYYSPNHANTPGDPNKPFLTTYQNNKDKADPPTGMTVPVNNSVWIVEYASTETVNNDKIDYYYLIHAATGKYVIYEVPLPNDPNKNAEATEGNNGKRKTMHLQTPDNETYSLSNNENYKFTITRTGEENNYIYRIQPKNRSGWYWNPANGNKDSYSGLELKTANLYQSGLVGVYDKPDDGGSKWRFNPTLCQAPSINYDALAGQYTITTELPNDYDIRYTTDGNAPDINSPIYDGSTITVQTNNTTVKAIVTAFGMVLSDVATKVVNTNLPDPPTFEVTCDSKLQINSDIPGASLYYNYTTDETEPANPDNNSTPWTEPVSLADGAKVKAIAYNGENPSQVSTVYTFYVKTASPSVTLSPSEATISFANGATIYYTTNGNDPVIGEEGVTALSGPSPQIVSISDDTDLDFRVIAKLDDHDQSCPVIVVKRPKKPTIQAVNACSEDPIPVRSHTLTFESTEDTKTYWYALSNGNGQAAPALNTFTEYTPGTSVDIAAIPDWDQTSVNVTLHAYAKDTEGNPSVVVSQDYMLKYTAAPVITNSGTTVTITAAAGAAIKYTLDGGSEQTYSTPFTVTDGYGHVVTATAQVDGEGLSCETTYNIRLATTITTLSQITDMNGAYNLNADIEIPEDFSGFGTFTGSLNGNYHTITGLSKALFNTINGGTVMNVILDEVEITGGNSDGNAGAICNEADGATKIYNCGIISGSVSGSGNVGGLVGLINSGSKVRVVNCYNYADVSSTGDYAAGIVGKNEGTIASNKTVGNVRIALCMMYGSVSGATHRSPVYGGNHVSNAQNFTEYNYYLYSNKRDADGNIVKKINYTSGDYNDQLAIEKDDYLTRFPFYRHILNTHRELAAFFLFGAPTTNSARNITSAQVEEIGHWVVKKGTDAPKYPVVEAWGKNTKTTPYYNSSTDNNYTPPTTTDDYAGKLLTDMGSDGNYKGYLKVTVKMSSDHTVYLPITDMDTLRYDYNYGKVILPFANEYEVNTDYTRICTGWKITNVDGQGTFSIPSNEPYNFCDRNNKQKDIYNATNNPYIFAQGGYYIVPKGVKSIEITPNYATAYYLSDASYDIGLNTSYGGETPLGGTVPNGANAFHGQTVYTSLSDALGAMTGTTNNPHQKAIVLVGNYHFDGAGLTDTKAFTFMSIDEDCNQEPDYGFYMYNKYDRPTAPAMRFDFLPVIPVGWAAHVAGSGGFKGVPIWKVRGWFEITETCVFYTDQCEIDSQNFKEDNNGKGNNPWVINSGYFVQIVRSNKNSTGCNKVSYIKMGGNVYVKEFYPGAHSEVSGKTTTIVPVNVTGGEIKECFMTGYNNKCFAAGENIRFWCAGGKIHKFLGAYMDKPTSATVNVTANIDHALITRFYGGGTSADASITGAINVTITNSKVDFYCGGPEFSILTAKPTVTTIASNTIFGQYYGAGFGGTSITYNLSKQESGYDITSDIVTFPIAFSNYKRLQKLTEGGKSLGTCYKLEYIHHSRQQQLVARFFTGYAEFSLATTGNVSNTLDGCTIKSDFYGAGCQGKVDGTVKSSLINCKVDGSVYGGGYKATANEVKVYTSTKPTYSDYYKETAIFSEFGTVEPNTYKWESGTAGTANEGSGILYTDAPMDQLGVVTDDITLTIKGKKSDATYTVKDNVFGGGNESPSEKKTTVVIEDYVDKNNNATGTVVQGSVFGGGNEASVGTDSKVTLKGSTNVQGNVFGGGNKAVVSGSATVNIVEE